MGTAEEDEDKDENKDEDKEEEGMSHVYKGVKAMNFPTIN